MQTKIIVGYPKLKAYIHNNNMINMVTNLLEIDREILVDILDGNNNQDFSAIQTIKICKYLQIMPEDYF